VWNRAARAGSSSRHATGCGPSRGGPVHAARRAEAADTAPRARALSRRHPEVSSSSRAGVAVGQHAAGRAPPCDAANTSRAPVNTQFFPLRPTAGSHDPGTMYVRPSGGQNLSAAVAELAARAERSRSDELTGVGRRCAERLRRPLCTAVVGRVSTGKSTLLNALLGTPVAPTDGRECTKVVHVLRHGRFVTASLVPRTGRDPTPVHFEGSRLPSELDRRRARTRCCTASGAPLPRTRRTRSTPSARATGPNGSAPEPQSGSSPRPIRPGATPRWPGRPPPNSQPTCRSATQTCSRPWCR
jgi:hypothetical protein